MAFHDYVHVGYGVTLVSKVMQGLVPWCLGVGQVVQGGLVSQCPSVEQERSVLSAKDLKVYRCAQGGQQSHTHDLKKEKHLFANRFLG